MMLGQKKNVHQHLARDNNQGLQRKSLLLGNGSVWGMKWDQKGELPLPSVVCRQGFRITE